MQILPTITTITPSAWREKIAEVKKFKLEEVCLFLTRVNAAQRKELYSLLKETSVKSVPFAHIRTDMPAEELEYLIKNYGTKVFNIHTGREFPLVYDYGKYKKNIYIENTREVLDENEIREFGGICLDFSHLESARLMGLEIYEADVKALAKYPIGCCHISGIKAEASLNEKSQLRYATHHLTTFAEFDYLKRYPRHYFVSPMAIELENSIGEQLKAQEYLRTLIMEIK